MKKYRLFLLWLLGTLLAPQGAFAQDRPEGKVHSVIVDAETRLPIAQAEVRAEGRSGGSINSNTLSTDSLGRFSAAIIGEKGFIEVQALGYHPQIRRFLTMDGIDLNLDTIALRPSEVLLGTAVVNGKARRFITRGDTIIYNPEAFQLKEGAKLEDLLSKLPGVTVKDGKLYWNNKPLRLMMNGQEGIGSNLTMMGQLPAEAIDRIKSYDKASDEERKAGKKDGEEDQVLDIIVKPGFLDKWYGTAQASWWQKGTYMGELRTMRLSTKTPMMLVLNANNKGWIHSTGDLMGTNINGGFAGLEQFGSFSAQHNWTKRQGKESLENFVMLSGTMAHNNSDNYDFRTLKENFQPDGSRTFSLLKHLTNTNNVKPMFRFYSTLRPDSANTYTFKGGVSYTRSRALTTQRNAVFGAHPYDLAGDPLADAFSPSAPPAVRQALITTADENTLTRSDEFNSSLNTEWNHSFRNKDVLTTKLSYNYVHTKETQTDLQHYNYLRGSGREDTHVIRRQPSHKLSLEGEVNYSSWLTKDFQLFTGYSFNYDNHHTRRDYFRLSDLSTYAPDRYFPEDSLAKVRSASASYNRHNDYWRHYLQLRTFWRMGKVELSTNTYGIFHREKMYYAQGRVDTTALRTATRIVPSAKLKWKINAQHVLEASYTYNTKLPDLLSAIDYFDDSDPLMWRRGNSRLGREHAHGPKLNYYFFDNARQRNLNASLSYAKSIHTIVWQYLYDATRGGYTQMPVNMKGGNAWELATTFNQSYGEGFNTSLKLSGKRGNTYGNLATQSPTEIPRMNHLKEWSYSIAPEWSYDGKHFKALVGGTYKYYYYRNSEQINFNNHLSDYALQTKAGYKTDRFEVEGELELTGKHGYAFREMNRVQPVLSLTASHGFFKKRLWVEFEWRDIFKKAKFYSSELTAYDRTEDVYNILTHWIGVTLRYNFGKGGE